MCIYIAEYGSLRILCDVLDMRCSGLKVNTGKSKLIGIGTSSNFRHRNLGIKWPSDSIKCLVVYIHNDMNVMI
jgi:hypothetical protein